MNKYHEFQETKKLYEEALSIKAPISFEDWLSLPSEHKAIALFINFYDQIVLAWTKAKADFTDEEDGISIVMQYLMKNVPIICANPNKYKEPYIYKVAYNCMSSLRRVKCEQARYKECMSEWDINSDIQKDNVYNEYETSWFDILGTDLFGEKLHVAADMLQNLYYNLGPDEKAIINNIVKGTQLGKKAKKKEAQVYDMLRKIFKMFSSDFLYPNLICETFADVLKYDSLIDSAVVVMRDGTKAVYCGEKKVFKNGKTEIVFFGPKHDYFIPVNVTFDLKVLSVEMYDD